MKAQPIPIPTTATRRSLALLSGAVVLGALSLSTPANAQLSTDEGYRLVRDLMGDSKKIRRKAANRLEKEGGATWAVPVVDALFFTPSINRAESFAFLRSVSGQNHGKRYLDWIEWVGGAGLEPPPGYYEFKRSLLARIDPRYESVFYDGAPMKIRFEEIVSGGVRLNGIPAIVDPEQVAADDAGFMAARDRVFGVVVGDDVRAYPVKVLSWHEMLNDIVGGEPIMISYCTLCGSAVLYKTAAPNGKRIGFGTSGLLYRSNKLMFDQSTLSLWNNLTGEAVVGRKAVANSRLEMLPIVLTTWAKWKDRHPETTIMKPDPDLERQWGFRYLEGAAERARTGVSFPVWQKSDALAGNTEVFVLRAGSATRAWPLEPLARRGLLNDRVGALAVLLLADEAGGVRAYARSDISFSMKDGVLVDDDGQPWKITSDRLEPPGNEQRADLETPASFERLPGHVAYWFGWYGMEPDTELWTP